jgi:hypothetical protein
MKVIKKTKLQNSLLISFSVKFRGLGENEKKWGFVTVCLHLPTYFNVQTELCSNLI